MLPVLADLTSWLVEHSADGPVAGSPVAIEVDAERADDSLEVRLLSLAAEAAVALTWSACGHLDGLRRLMGAKDEVPHPHALVSLARGCIENAALATWLASSDIDANERGRRSAGYQLHGLAEHRKLGLGDDDSGELRKVIEGVVSERGWKVSLPAKTDLVALLFGDDEMDPGDAFGAFGYRVHSAIAHGSFHALLEFFHPAGDDGGAVGATGPQAFTLCLLPAASALQLLGYQLVAAFGLPADQWGAVIRRCLQVDVRHLVDTYM